MTITDLFAARLKSLREERGLSQSQLADALGVSRGSISFYENGERTPDIAFLAQVKEYFRVQLDYLLGYTEEKYAEPLFEFNTFIKLPEYAQNRIEGVKGRMAEVAEQYIPAEGNDPHKLFDCLHRDVLATIESYANLKENLSSEWEKQQSALEQFKTDLGRSSEIEIIRHLYEQDFMVKKRIASFSKPSIQEEPPKKKGWKKK